MTRVKICGLTREADVDLAVELGAHAVGFVLEPTSPRCISVERAEELARRTAPFCMPVAVYGRTHEPFPRVAAFQSVQFRSEPPGLVIQTIRLGSTEMPDLEHANAVVLDAFSKKGYGGTGETVDWDEAALYVSRTSLPVILAGGLTPENVAEAIRTVKPYAVDVSSGVETEPGAKDHGRLRAFFAAVGNP